MQFPSQEFTNQYISESYQNILQKYSDSGLFYLLDASGNVVAILNTSSVGDLIITSNMTSSMSVASASYASTYSYVLAESSSFASSSISSSVSQTSSFSKLSFESLFSDTSSYTLTSTFSDTASLSIDSIYAITASNSLTASYALNGGGGGGGGLNIPNYDYSVLTYNGPLGQMSDCTYKIGGSSGTIVCIITAIYNGNMFMGISKSLG